MCFRSLEQSLNDTNRELDLPECRLDGTHQHPTVLLFLAVGLKQQQRVNHTCTTARAAGFDLFLTHYDDGQQHYRDTYEWYGSVRYTFRHTHTNCHAANRTKGPSREGASHSAGRPVPPQT